MRMAKGDVSDMNDVEKEGSGGMLAVGWSGKG